MSKSLNAPTVLTVTQLTQNIKISLESHFSRVWVTGEISNFIHHSSGHMYFSIKDAQARVSAVMFRGQNRRLRFRPSNGQQVTVLGDISVYPPRGQYQLVVDQLLPSGEGDLYLAFEALKQKLAAEGLFDELHKQLLPPYPEHIGVVTSATGAAIRDMIQVITRRFPLAKILLYNAKVQGIGAGIEIARGIQLLNAETACEVLIVGRGGGSLEDLWPFNEEQVAKAIYDSRIPIVSAVGHEVDVTISDWVADVRAPTPSAAAELVVPDQATLRTTLDNTTNYLPQLLRKRVRQVKTQLEGLAHNYVLRRPHLLIQGYFQYLDQVNDTLQRLLQQRLVDSRRVVNNIQDRLILLNPSNILERGYAIVQRDAGQIVKSVRTLSLNQSVHVTLHEGKFDAKVEQLHESQDNE